MAIDLCWSTLQQFLSLHLEGICLTYSPENLHVPWKKKWLEDYVPFEMAPFKILGDVR